MSEKEQQELNDARSKAQARCYKVNNDYQDTMDGLLKHEIELTKKNGKKWYKETFEGVCQEYRRFHKRSTELGLEIL